MVKTIGTKTVYDSNGHQGAIIPDAKASDMNYGNIDITTADTTIVASNANRISLLVYNNSDATIYLGGSGVTTSTGYALLAGKSFEYKDTETLHGIHGGSGNKDLRYIELVV